MLVRCPQCGLSGKVPEERAATPGLRLKCRCGVSFEAAANAVADAPAAAPPPPPAPAPVAAAVPPPPPPVATAAAPAAPRPGQWRRCANHVQARSTSVCPACAVGFCRECENRVRNVPVCPRCEGLCVEADVYEQKQTQQKQRERSFGEELGVIARYPFTDP